MPEINAPLGTDSPAVSTLAVGVAQVLEVRIRDGALPVGRALPSERELAVQFGVSRAVIRTAIDELAKKGLLHSRPNHRPVVRGVSHGPSHKSDAVRTRNIGVWLWPSSGHFSAASILKGIQSTNLGPDVHVIVGSGATGKDWVSVIESENDFLTGLAENPATMGAIVWYLGGEENLPSLRKLRDRNLPIVFVDRLPPKGFEVDYVGTNNEDAAAHAVQHLLSLGHRRIGMISNIDPASSVAEREAGYLRALSEAGVAFEDNWIYRTTYDTVEGVTSTVDNLLRQPNPVTAVFCVNDLLALHVQDILGRKGVSMPADFSIVGFDGLLRWVPGGGYLTTMAQDFERMGRIAATLVAERAAGNGPLAFRHYLLDAPLISAASTASPTRDQRQVDKQQGCQQVSSARDSYPYSSSIPTGSVPDASSMETH